jgi:hypothetical protein
MQPGSLCSSFEQVGSVKVVKFMCTIGYGYRMGVELEIISSQCASNRTILHVDPISMESSWCRFASGTIDRSLSFLSRTATICTCGGRRRSNLCRSISASTVFVFQTPLDLCDHHQELIQGTSPAAIASRHGRGWTAADMSSRSGRRGRSQRLLRHREGGVSLTQQRFASDDNNYRRSKFKIQGSLH